MKLKGVVRIAFALALCCASLFGQTVASSVEGTVVDPADAAIVGAPVTLTSAETGAVRTGTTDSYGTFRFLNLRPGTYNVTVKVVGFKTATRDGIVVAAEENHNAGRMVLELGSVTETATVTAEPAQVQVTSSEASQTIGAAHLEDLTLKGRDLFGYVRLVPGVIDTLATRDVTSHSAFSGIIINGNTALSNTLNFMVDGITDMDTGSNGSNHYEPNLDSIQELRILTTNYQAEYGRNSGGTITVVTKNGTKDFHGTAQWSHRHEEFDADSWANNHTIKNGAATPRAPYRFNVETYSLGGPVFIPKHWNRDRKRLFFFWSQEYTAQFVTGGSESMYTPTTLERAGNFSQSFNNNGSLISVLDPNNNNIAFPGNIIPASRINPVGQQLLNFFPAPNFTATLPAQMNVVNYFEQASAKHPRRNDVLRFDTYITSKLSGYFRWINDYDDTVQLYQGVQFSSDVGGVLGQGGISPIDHPNGGHGYSGTATYTITPTLINEVTVAESWDTYSFYTLDNMKSESRSLEPGLPSLFPVPTTADNNGVLAINGYLNILPTFSFGSAPANAMSYSRNGSTAGTYQNANPIWTYQDNLSKVYGHHGFKMGIYVEHNIKYQPKGNNYMGAFSFASSTSTPQLNTNDGFANALLGNVNSYSQWTATTTFDVKYWNVEFYVQDNWKVSPRLTLDVGLRFYHQTPQVDYADTFVNFNPSVYSASAMPRIYVPACSNGAATCTSAANGLVAKDPLTGATASNGLVGDFVPNSGNPTSGMQVLRTNGAPNALYSMSPLALGPRLGFAYDVFGDGTTAIRGGFGMFYNRLDGNQVYTSSGQAPLAYNVSVSNVSLAQIAAQNTGAPPSLASLSTAPNGPQIWLPSKVPWDTVMNASLDVQRSFGTNTVVSVGTTWDRAYNQHILYNPNWIPIGTGWPFTPSNINPTTAGSTSTDIGSIFERKIFPGYGTMSTAAFVGESVYDALTATLQRRLSHGLVVGVAYTFSKAMGDTAFTPAVANNKEWNYGRVAGDRPQNFQMNFNYNIPGLAKKLGVKGLGALTDHWELSGILSSQSGAPFSPTCGLTSGAASVTGGYTGTPDVSARCQVVGNPLANIPTSGYGKVYFNPAAFALPGIATGPDNSMVGPPVLGDLGGGAGVLRLPHITNFDLTVAKNVPLGSSEKRVLRFQVQAYNVFNHTEINALGTGIQFTPSTNQVSNASSMGYATGTLPSRVLAGTIRIEF
jgi:hypothetical protein